MPTLAVPRASLDYSVSGVGPTVIHLHGLTSSRARDARLGLDVTAGLAERRLVKYDARGHGLSEGSTDPDDYVWPQLADDLLALVDEVMRDEPHGAVHGVGTSMGAGTLLHAAARHPERFASLTLVIPPTAWEGRLPQAAAYRDSADFIDRRGVARWARAARLLPLPPAVDPQRPESLPDVTDELAPAVFRGAARSDLPEIAALAALRIPTLLLAWIDDPSHPLSTARTLHESLPAASLRIAHTPDDVATWPEVLADHVSGTVGV